MRAQSLSAQQKTMNQPPNSKEEIYGQLPDGRPVRIYTLTNGKGLMIRVMEYGAILVSVEVPDMAGNVADVTHGYDTLEGWLGNNSYFGASIGRFGNRIRNGKFELDGIQYTLATNNEPGGLPCHLHGGSTGFDKVLWSGKMIGENRVEFTYQSPNDEEGYPGNLEAKVIYTLNEDNEFHWEATAKTDAPTIINMVHHTYWNLTGDPTRSINSHELTLNALHYLPTDEGLIPTGEIAEVANTPMDFTKPTAIGARMEADFEPLKFAGGYDHCWILEKGGELQYAAKLRDPSSGRIMEVLTNQPAIQFYGGNFLDGSAIGKNDIPYTKHSALCLETEGFPDAPNQPTFPSAVLRPGEIYHHKLVHRFSHD